jgi:hypothetical protein
MLEVGCPDPALVEERIESTRSWAAKWATVSRSVCVETMLVMTLLPVAAK